MKASGKVKRSLFAGHSGIVWSIVGVIAVGVLVLLRFPHSMAPIPADPHTSALQDYHTQNTSAMPLITLWSSDFHISPIADLKSLLQGYNVRFLDKSLSNHCHLTNTCADNLSVLNKFNGITLGKCPNALRREFYAHYRQDREFLSADVLVCTHAMPICELFMAFCKPMVLIASTRYEIGRHDAISWGRWNANLRVILSNPFNTLAANNQYDLEYLKYFTGLSEIAYLPSYCGYVNTWYAPQREKPFLLAPARGVSYVLHAELFKALKAHNEATPSKPFVIKAIRDVYPIHFQYSDLSQHPGIVLLPYQVSIMSLFEYYRMGIPLFVPTPALLAEWHLKYQVLNERTWDMVYGHPSERSLLPKHPNSTCALKSDPNNEYSLEAVTEWIRLADFYTFPHITVFDSFEQLLMQLQTADLANISASMQTYNTKVKASLHAEWRAILGKVVRFKEESHKSLRVELPMDVNQALKEAYGFTLSETDCHTQVYGSESTV